MGCLPASAAAPPGLRRDCAAPRCDRPAGRGPRAGVGCTCCWRCRRRPRTRCGARAPSRSSAPRRDLSWPGRSADNSGARRRPGTPCRRNRRSACRCGRHRTTGRRRGSSADAAPWERRACGRRHRPRPSRTGRGCADGRHRHGRAPGTDPSHGTRRPNRATRRTSPPVWQAWPGRHRSLSRLKTVTSCPRDASARSSRSTDASMPLPRRTKLLTMRTLTGRRTARARRGRARRRRRSSQGRRESPRTLRRPRRRCRWRRRRGRCIPRRASSRHG